MFKAQFFTVLVFFFLFFSFSYAQSGFGTVFYDDLREGMSSPNVLSLQKILNSDPATQVAVLGPGSPGNETQYFGKATRAAIIRFQNKYAAEILSPAGLSSGTGYVGPLTRAALNRISLGLNSENSGNSENESGNPLNNFTGQFGSASEELHLAFPSSYEGKTGSTIILSGSGFTPTSNTVHLGPNKIENIKAQNSSMISLTIPQNISPGRYEISVSNQKGIAPEKSFFVVTAPGSARPVIEKVEPTVGGLNQSIKITGANFSPTGNEVRSNFGIFSNLSSSDGKTIIFTPQFSLAADLQSGLDKVNGLELKMNFYVVNGNGVSGKNNPGVYIIKNI